MDRLAPTRRPDGSPIGRQTWTGLLFVHWRVPVEQVRPLVPAPLEIDTFDGAAWIGLVPFHMSGVRPWWCPALPGVSTFHETNLRTYVHRRGEDPGVWFLSLDAACRPAVEVARWKWHLNYFHAEMVLRRDGNRVTYRSRRRDRRCSVPAEVSMEASLDGVPATAAVPRSLEHFLAERYLLYSSDGRGRLYRGQVHHRPYPLQPAELVQCHQSLSNAAGLVLPGPPEHVLFSPGVTVDIFPLRRLNR